MGKRRGGIRFERGTVIQHMNYKVTGNRKLAGTVATNISKNAAVALLCASLLNHGTTTLKRMPRIEEVNDLSFKKQGDVDGR